MSEKRRTIVAPWRSVAEFQQVYDEIFGANNTPNTRHRALTQMQMWSAKRSTLCPAGILATSVLLEVQLLDEEQRYGASEMQTLYANAFMRFFNFMSSTMQTHNMRTMYETARHLGLDSFVVDIRHLCAHGQQLPPLELLQRTTSYCMQWLADYYWRSQLTNMREVNAKKLRRRDRTQLDDKFVELFGVYDAALECHLKGAINMKMAKRHVHGRRYVALKSYYDEHKLTELCHIFGVLVQQFSEILRRESSTKDLSDIFVDALFDMRYFFVVAAAGRIPRKLLATLIAATQELFRLLAVQHMLEPLLYALLQHAENHLVDTARRAGAGFWAAKIVEGFVAFHKCKKSYKLELEESCTTAKYDFATNNIHRPMKSLRKLLTQNRVNMAYTLIFADTMQRPWVWQFDRSFLQQHLESLNEHTAPALKALLPLIEPALAKREVHTVQVLIDALYACNVRYQKALENVEKAINKMDCDDVEDGIYTAADLLQRLEQTTTTTPTTTMPLTAASRKTLVLQQHASNEEQQHYGLWSTVPDDLANNWTICPLGKLPWT